MSGTNKKPNVIFLVIDALRAQNLSCYGYPKKTSPFIDSLAKKGVMFDNFYSCTDQTDPSFTTMFSGRYPLTHGIIFHGGSIPPSQITELKKTGTKFLAELLKLKNDDMLMIGFDWLSRWHKRGFDIYGEEEIMVGKKGLLGRYKWLNEKLKLKINKLPLGAYYIFNKILAPFGFLNRKDAEGYFNYARHTLKTQVLKKDKSFFMLIHLWDVHSPWNGLPNGYVNKFDDGKREMPVTKSLGKYKHKKWRKTVKSYHLKGIEYLSEVEVRYNASINYVDTELSKFVEFLKTKGLWDNTYLFITGDHGDNLVVDDWFVGHGGTHNRVMKVPLIIVGPGIPKKRVHELSQHVDVLPTILDIYNLKTDYKYDGSSLMPLIKGKKTRWRDEIFFVASTADKRYTLMSPRYKFTYSPTEKDSKDKFGGIWHYERVELFDLKNDPNEEINIVAEKPELAALMETRMKQILSKLKKQKEKYKLTTSISKLKPGLK